MQKTLIGQILTSAALMLALTVNAWAGDTELTFADILTDNMVLQRGRPIVLWGTAPPESDVEVLLTQSRDEAVAFVGEDALARPETKPSQEPHPAIGKVRLAYIEDRTAAFKSVTTRVRAGDDGRWEATLGEQAATFVPTYLAARAGDECIAIQNLLIGEVWIASGQSNMEWAWTRDKMWENKGLVFNGLRYAKVRGASVSPRDSFVGNATVERGAAFEPWIVCEDGNVDAVATIPYLFGQYLHRRLKVPVGVINVAQGGSFGHEWCSRELLERMNSPTVDALLSAFDAKQNGENEVKWRGAPTELYNARLYPIRKLVVAGVIYMQGENDSLSGTLAQYVKTFPGVIQSYREAFGRPVLPFGIITLQGYGGYAEAREIHLATHTSTENTGYIVAHDIGGGIHPKWKRPLAERAVYWALRDVYGVLNKVEQLRIKRVDFNDGQAIVGFETVELINGTWSTPADCGPKTNDEQAPTGFEIAGADRAWQRARISIVGDSLALTHPLVATPIAMRYAWGGFPCGNLGSWEDPVPPYRTDRWPIAGDDVAPEGDATEGEPRAAQYLAGHTRRNRQLEEELTVAIIDGYTDWLKRYAHPKGVLLKSVESMQQLLLNFDAEKCRELAPELARHALHRIPCRYWRQDRYTPGRRAKWGWLIERVLRLETLPGDMDATLNKPAVKQKLAALNEALEDLNAELRKQPDPETMDFDAMLDRIMPIMQQEKERLTNEGVDMEKQSNELNENPF